LEVMFLIFASVVAKSKSHCTKKQKAVHDSFL
jgi:hypothetical protein